MELYPKRITLKLLFKLSYLSSNFALTQGYLNRASNNPAQAINSEQSFDPSSKKYPESCPVLYDESFNKGSGSSIPHPSFSALYAVWRAPSFHPTITANASPTMYICSPGKGRLAHSSVS